MTEMNLNEAFLALNQQQIEETFSLKSPSITPLYLGSFQETCEMEAENHVNFSLEESLSVYFNKSYDDVKSQANLDIFDPILEAEDQIYQIRQEENSSQHENNQIDNHIDNQIDNQIDNHIDNHIKLSAEEQAVKFQIQEMRNVITYFINHTDKSKEQTNRFLKLEFPHLRDVIFIQKMAEKFKQIKKTKEELTKYCMRKAFKFIIEVQNHKNFENKFKPNQRGNNKQQKLSLSTFKNAFLKKISSEKSMNNKFLRQIFSEGDFLEYYRQFLKVLPEIVEEDNKKKIEYLANFLSESSENNHNLQSVQMIRRLPWSRLMLKKAEKLGHELLKHSKAPPEK